MPFFQREPFTRAEAIYAWSGVNQPGFIQVTVQGEAPKISFGFQLRQGGLFTAHETKVEIGVST
jgi:hypothetical protein